MKIKNIIDGGIREHIYFMIILELVCCAGICAGIYAGQKAVLPEEYPVQSITENDMEENEQDRKKEEAPRIALTFDDGPSIYTKELSMGLKKRGVRASFFLLGMNIEGNEEGVKQLAADGHLIGNHSFHHVQLNKLPAKKACDEIIRTNNAIYEITGAYPIFMRPPYGEWSKQLECGVEMIPVFWNVDSLDWKLQNTSGIVKYVLAQVKQGDIILMHDGYDTSVAAAFEIVDELQKQGYEFVTADELTLS